jgi:hypothetical protein
MMLAFLPGGRAGLHGTPQKRRRMRLGRNPRLIYSCARKKPTVLQPHVHPDLTGAPCIDLPQFIDAKAEPSDRRAQVVLTDRA